jgi:formate hydrogenlyase subunit 3/multisubunit Na+/H+ antiporter MnhD subunit
MAILIIGPLLGALLIFCLPRYAKLLGLLVALAMPLAALGLAITVYQSGPLSVSLGGWSPPLGIGLYADGLAALLLCLSALVGLGASVYSLGYFHDQDTFHDQISSAENTNNWWPLWLLLWSAINALFLAADAFNLYVTLELMGLAAVGLVALEAKAIAAAIRYLLVGLTASLFYLLGVGLLYGLYGSMDLAGLKLLVQPEPAAWVAMALIVGALLMKTAIFPLHFWLPPAHAGAPAPVSALLSALVVSAAFYILLRLWLGPFATLITPLAGQILGVLGVLAVLWGGLQALQATRLKLVVAYSTVAQLGYLFLVFPFLSSHLSSEQSQSVAALAWYGSIWLALAHGLAKAGLFLAAGNILHSLGHDRVHDLAGINRSLPISLFAIGLACVSLMGLPPAGGFLGKWMMLNAAFVSGQWWWALALLGGGLLSAAYGFRVLLYAFRNPTVSEVVEIKHRPQPLMEWCALILAAAALVLGIFSAYPLSLLAVGADTGLSLLEVMP